MFINRKAYTETEALLIANAADEEHATVLSITDAGYDPGWAVTPSRFIVWIEVSPHCDHEGRVNDHINAVLERALGNVLTPKELAMLQVERAK